MSPHSSCDGTERYPAQLRGIEEEAMVYRRAVSKYLRLEVYRSSRTHREGEEMFRGDWTKSVAL